MANQEKEIGLKLLHGMPEDFEPAVLEATVGDITVFNNTLYGGPFHPDRICPFCHEHNARGIGEPCPHCGRIE